MGGVSGGHTCNPPPVSGWDTLSGAGGKGGGGGVSSPSVPVFSVLSPLIGLDSLGVTLGGAEATLEAAEDPPEAKLGAFGLSPPPPIGSSAWPWPSSDISLHTGGPTLFLYLHFSFLFLNKQGGPKRGSNPEGRFCSTNIQYKDGLECIMEDAALVTSFICWSVLSLAQPTARRRSPCAPPPTVCPVRRHRGQEKPSAHTDRKLL